MNISASTSKSPLGYWQNRYNANQSEKFSIAGMVKRNENTPAAKSEHTVQAKLRRLSQADDHEKVNEAVKAYTWMQSTLMQRIASEENKIKCYNELDGEINYYTDLLQQCGSSDRVYVDDPKYDLSGSGSRCVMRSDIEKHLEKAETLFDGLVNWEPINDVMRIANCAHAMDFANAAAVFSEATGIASDWLDISDDISLFSYHEGITKENYVETAEKKIESLKARSNGLAELMKEYKKKLEEKGLIDEVDFKENYNFKVIETIRQEFLRTGKFNDPEKTFSLLNVLG